MDRLKIVITIVFMIVNISIWLYAEDNRVVITSGEPTSKWAISLLEGDDYNDPAIIKEISNSAIIIDNKGNIQIVYSWANGAKTFEAAERIRGQWGIRYATFKNGKWVKEEVSNDLRISGLFVAVENDILYIAYHSLPSGKYLIYKRIDIGWDVKDFDYSLYITGEEQDVFSLVVGKNNDSHLLYYKYIFSRGYIMMYTKPSGVDWIREEVSLDAYRAPASLALDKNDSPHIAGKLGSKLRYLKKVSGNWQGEDVESNITLLLCSIALDKNDYPHILYICTPVNTTWYQLKYARWNGNTWQISKIMDFPDSSSNFLLSSKLDSLDYANIVMSYTDGSDTVMKYLKLKDTEATMEEIDSNKEKIGKSLSMALDNKNAPHVTYSGSGTGLWYATNIQKIAESREDKLIPVNNYFNASSDKATIIYKLSQQGLAKVRIYTINGELIRTLVEEEKGEGTYTVEWDGKDEFGGIVGSGLYFVVLEASGVKEVKKICVVR